MCSHSYMVTSQLFNASGVVAHSGILQGQTTVMSNAGLSSKSAGQVHFADLCVTRTGEGWYIIFSDVPDCKFDAQTMLAAVCDDNYVLSTTLKKRSQNIDVVGHDNPSHLEFVSQPRNTTSRFAIRGKSRIPWVQVRLLDLHHNPVTCSGRKLILRLHRHSHQTRKRGRLISSCFYYQYVTLHLFLH